MRGSLIAALAMMTATAACSPPASSPTHTTPEKSAPVAAPTPSPSPSLYRLTCDAGFSASTTKADLEKRFGVENVVDEPFALGEGDVGPGSVLFPKDPSRRLEILWLKPGVGASALRASGDGSQWRGLDGLAIGMTLTDVEALNGAPFSMAGFDWDYGGTATDWGQGKLATGPDGCSVTVRFGYAENADRALVEQVVGDGSFPSTHPAMRTLNPKVYTLILNPPALRMLEEK